MRKQCILKKKRKMSKIADSVLRIQCSNEGDFIRKWLTFLTPLHKMTPSIVTLASEIIRKRIELGRVISDDKVLDKFLFTDEDVRKEIIGKCGISTSNYHVGITKLKKAGFFINGGVNPKFVHKIDVGATKYSMILLFTIPETNEESGESTT